MGIWDDLARSEGVRKLRRALLGNGEVGMTPEDIASVEPPEGFVALIREDAVPDGAFLHIDIKGMDIALGRIEGALRAISNNCPHAGGPMHQGTLRGTSLTCPWHRWCFDVTTGASRTIKGQVLPTFEVKVKAGVVFINLHDGDGEGE